MGEDPKGPSSPIPKEHRSCRINLDLVGTFLHHLPTTNEQTPLPSGAMHREVWHVNTAILPIFTDWWEKQPSGGDLTLVPPIVMFFTIPPTPDLFGDANVWHVGANKNGQPMFALAHWCRTMSGMASSLENERQYSTLGTPAEVMRNAAYMLRRFALTSPAERRGVDIDLAEPTGTARSQGIPTIVVVKWRKPPSNRPPEDERAPGFINWSHRWTVRAHLRQLPTGQLTFVRAHGKGPADKPLVLKARINTLSR